MKLGLLFPTCDIGSDPIAIRDYVEAAEGLGFDRLLCFDHVLRRLWTEPVVDYHGRFHRIDRAGILPRPASPIPIWFGGASPQAYERVARRAGGTHFSVQLTEYGAERLGAR